MESVEKVLSQVDDSQLDSDCLFDIESEVIDIAARWESFGSALRIPPAKLSTIKATPGSTPESCLKDTLLEFLRKNYDYATHGKPSWKLIVRAVAHRAGGNNVELALRIAKDHSINPDPTSSPTGRDDSASVNRDKSILEEKPDLRYIQYIKYKSGTDIEECRAIDDIATEIEAVALQLGVRRSRIKNTIKPTPVDRAAAILGYWLDSDTSATWAKLITAMRTKEDLAAAAKELETALLNMIPN